MENNDKSKTLLEERFIGEEYEDNSDLEEYEFMFQSDHFYDKIDITSFERKGDVFYYPCPCGDLFEISLEDLKNNECIARCPSCSLIVQVIYDESEVALY